MTLIMGKTFLVFHLNLNKFTTSPLLYSNMYWTSETAGHIMRSQMDGRSIVRVVTGRNEPEGITMDGLRRLQDFLD